MKLFAVTIKHPLRGIPAIHAEVLALNPTQALVLTKDEFVQQYCKRLNTTWQDIPADFWTNSTCSAIHMDRAQVQRLTYALSPVPEG
jgi:hypothetical protein